MKYHDSLLGFITPSPLEERVLGSRAVRRLQGIRQLGAAYFVFPGATHTRFAHSLGMMEYATRFHDQLVSRYDGWIPFDKDRTRQIVRLGALLHDLGHPPFSHNIERAMRNEYEGEEVRQTRGLAAQNPHADHPLYADLPVKIKLGRPWDHETIGHAILQKSDLWPILQQGRVAEDVVRLLEKELLPPFVSHIISYGLDADKIDYLQRDSTSVGLGYGALDHEQIIGELTVHDNSLAIGEQAVTAVQHLHISRYLWYSGIVKNRRIDILERLVDTAYQELTHYAFPSGDYVFPRLAEYLTLIHESFVKVEAGTSPYTFFRFDDSFLIDRLHEAREKLPDLKERTAGRQYIDRPALALILERLLSGEGFDLVAHADAVEDGRALKHPLADAFDQFWKDVEVEYPNEVASRRIIITRPDVPFIKSEEEDRLPPIVPKHGAPKSVLRHPASFYQALVGENGSVALRFQGRRVFAEPALKDALKQKWAQMAGKVAG